MVSDAYKDVITGGVWATNAGTDDRDTPENEGLTRAEGWGVSFEQVGTGDYPQRTVFNEHHYEITSGLIDIANMGIPRWSSELDYRPSTGVDCFVTTDTGIWHTDQNTGPTFGNATDPDTANQSIWERY